VERSTDEFAVVTGEVHPGDRVVIDGQLRLRDGSRVQIKAPGDSARARAS
jgi:multidrug efflux pump subunit AcrA (membrane-fusion protein)